jgi:hypothetical protein
LRRPGGPAPTDEALVRISNLESQQSQ